MIKNNKILIAYVPVLHEGYRKFFAKHANVDKVYILGQDLISKFDHLYKEIRALKPELILSSLKNWDDIKGEVGILGEEELEKIGKEEDLEIIAPNEDIIKEIIKKYFPKAKAEFSPIFLRWDKHKSIDPKPVHSDKTVTKEEFDKKFIQLAYKQSKKSSDIWRRIGAVIVKDGKALLFGNNEATPSPHQVYVYGDPRGGFHKGEHIDKSIFIHAEAKLIAEAARKGISLEGAEMYVTTFPCPPCAKLIAYSGIKKLYYREGYGVLDAEQVLRSKGVEIVFVDVDIKEEKDSSLVKYKKKN